MCSSPCSPGVSAATACPHPWLVHDRRAELRVTATRRPVPSESRPKSDPRRPSSHRSTDLACPSRCLQPRTNCSWQLLNRQTPWSGPVGEGGLEPPHPFGHRNLNPARLPIPPLARWRCQGSRPPAGGSDLATAFRPGWVESHLTMGLQQFERRLERLVEGVFAKAFRSGLQPVELGCRITREMDLRRTVAPRGTLAPNHFTVAPSEADHQRFAPIEQELVAELVEAAREHARSERYVFLGAVTVELMTDADLTRGMLLVAGEMSAGDGPAALVLPDARRLTLGTEPVAIGRMPECAIALADPNVSRRHAEVRRADDGGGGYIIVDLGSTNGTKVNGIGVHSHRLQHGDEITVGSTHLRYEAQ